MRETDFCQAHRKELLDIMTSFIPIETVSFGKRLTHIEQRPESVALTFADGEVVVASALVGADGIKSLVREHVLNPLYPTEAEPVYADSYCYRGVISIAEAEEILGDLTDVAKFYFGDKRSAVTYRITGGSVSCAPIVKNVTNRSGIQLSSLRGRHRPTLGIETGRDRKGRPRDHDGRL